MLRKSFVLAVIIIFCASVSSFAQGLMVNSKEVEEGEALNLFYDDLDAGKINFATRSSGLKKAEITFDRGRNWQEMKSEGDYFIFSYHPLTDEVIIPELLLTSEDGKINTEKPGIKVNYQRKNPDDSVMQVLDKMKLHYEQENIDRFMSLFSSKFPDRLKFQESIQNDFYNYRNIRLFYNVDRKAFDDDFEGAIWDVEWKRKADTITAASIDDSAVISMRFEKESGTWLITGMRNNSIFGSSLLGTLDLSIAASDISFTDGVPTSGDTTVHVAVHNTGSAAVSGVKVNFFESGFTITGPWTLISSSIIPSIGGGSTATGSSALFSATPGFIWYFRVVVDPDGVIAEGDETNNEASIAHALP